MIGRRIDAQFDTNLGSNLWERRCGSVVFRSLKQLPPNRIQGRFHARFGRNFWSKTYVLQTFSVAP